MIQIDDLRVIKFDALNWTDDLKYTTQDGTTSWSTVGYFPILEIAAWNLCILAIVDQDSIIELIQATEKPKTRHDKNRIAYLSAYLTKNLPIWNLKNSLETTAYDLNQKKKMT